MCKKKEEVIDSSSLREVGFSGMKEHSNLFWPFFTITKFNN
jgi:hypothetical protein